MQDSSFGIYSSNVKETEISRELLIKGENSKWTNYIYKIQKRQN